MTFRFIDIEDSVNYGPHEFSRMSDGNVSFSAHESDGTVVTADIEVGEFIAGIEKELEAKVILRTGNFNVEQSEFLIQSTLGVHSSDGPSTEDIDRAEEKARVLIEAVATIRDYRNKIVISDEDVAVLAEELRGAGVVMYMYDSEREVLARKLLESGKISVNGS